MKLQCVGVDPGTTCGLCVLEDGEIKAAYDVTQEGLYSRLTSILISSANTIIVVEDIRPYSSLLKPQVADTLKFIGELSYRLRIECGADCRFITRSQVQSWIFDSFPGVVLPLMTRKVDLRMFPACDVATKEEVERDKFGRARRKLNKSLVDDNIVTKCMKELFKIERLPGKPYPFGLKDHNWQALAIAAMFHSQAKVVNNPETPLLSYDNGCSLVGAGQLAKENIL